MKKYIIALICLSLFCGCQKKSTMISQTTREEHQETITLNEEGSRVVEPGFKQEAVHVDANAYGTPQEITVEATLKDFKDSDIIRDVSHLSDIMNKKGDEAFNQKDDGRLLWENHGQDIVYEGTSHDDLPISVRVSYYLNGHEIDAHELIGKSGHIKIRFDYINKKETTVKIKGTTYNMYVPFVALSALTLPSDTFSHIKVTNGKLVSQDDTTIAIGYALPGMKDNLRLADFDLTEEIDLPDYVEVSADTTDFSLDFTATIISSGLFEDLDLSSFDDVDDLTKGFKDMSKAFSKIVTGASKIYQGSRTFNKYLSQYVSGVNQVTRATSQISKQVTSAIDETGDLQDDVKKLAEVLKSLSRCLEKTDLEKLLADENLDAEDLVEAIKQMQSDVKTLKTGILNLPEILKESQSYVKTMTQCTKDLKNLEAGKLEASLEADAIKEATQKVKAVMDDYDLTDDQKKAILEAMESGIKEGIDLDSFVSQLTSIINTMSQANDDLSSLDLDMEAVEKCVGDLKDQMEILSPYLDEILNAEIQVEDVKNGIALLQSTMKDIGDDAGTLSDGITTFLSQVKSMKTIMKKMNQGTKTLEKGGAGLIKGHQQIEKSMKALANGLKRFDDEGMSKLTDLAGDDLEDVLKRFKGLAKADRYKNFSGIGHEDGSVSFVIETEKLTAD